MLLMPPATVQQGGLVCRRAECWCYDGLRHNTLLPRARSDPPVAQARTISAPPVQQHLLHRTCIPTPPTAHTCENHILPAAPRCSYVPRWLHHAHAARQLQRTLYTLAATLRVVTWLGTPLR